MAFTFAPLRGPSSQGASQRASQPAERKAASQPTPPVTAPPIVHQVLRHPGQPLDAHTRASLEPGLGFDFSRVRVHTGEQAAQSARAVNAAAYTVGCNIVFDAGQFAPRSPSGRDLLRHELMHVVQQRSALPAGALAIADIHSPLEREAGRVVPSLILQRQPKPQPPPKPPPKLPTSLSQYPEAERRKIHLFQGLPANIADKVDETFDPDRAGSYATDADTQIVFADAIANEHRKPLDTMANYIVGNPNPATRLGLNETATVPIAPMKQVLRFTYFEHNKPNKVILVEVVGPIQAPGTKEGEAKFKAKNYKFVPGWNAADKQVLFQALTLTPDSALSDGLSFERAPDDPTKADEAGVYDPNKHLIRMFDKAFKSAIPTQISMLAHEIGHAADYQPKREAKAVYEKSGKTAADLTTLQQALELSGWDMGTGTFGTDFRKAAQQDGIAPDTSSPPRKTRAKTDATLKGSPTDYGDTNWKELFAELFSLFVTDPPLLQAIRPNIYDYFVKRFPAPAPATPPPAKAPAPKP